MQPLNTCHAWIIKIQEKHARQSAQSTQQGIVFCSHCDNAAIFHSQDLHMLHVSIYCCLLVGYCIIKQIELCKTCLLPFRSAKHNWVISFLHRRGKLQNVSRLEPMNGPNLFISSMLDRNLLNNKKSSHTGTTSFAFDQFYFAHDFLNCSYF